MITPAKALAGLDALGLDDTERQRFLEDNAKRVFGLSEGVSSSNSRHCIDSAVSATTGAVSVRSLWSQL